MSNVSLRNLVFSFGLIASLAPAPSFANTLTASQVGAITTAEHQIMLEEEKLVEKAVGQPNGEIDASNLDEVTKIAQLEANMAALLQQAGLPPQVLASESLVVKTWEDLVEKLDASINDQQSVRALEYDLGGVYAGLGTAADSIIPSNVFATDVASNSVMFGSLSAIGGS
jgi:hypothetical protein